MPVLEEHEWDAFVDKVERNIQQVILLKLGFEHGAFD